MRRRFIRAFSVARCRVSRCAETSDSTNLLTTSFGRLVASSICFCAWREIGRLGLDKNIDRVGGCRSTFRELAEHFRQHELKKTLGIAVKAEETVATNELLLDKWVLPRWGDCKAADIKPLQIEAWFEALTSLPHGKKKAPFTWGSVSNLPINIQPLQSECLFGPQSC